MAAPLPSLLSRQGPSSFPVVWEWGQRERLNQAHRDRSIGARQEPAPWKQMGATGFGRLRDSKSTPTATRAALVSRTFLPLANRLDTHRDGDCLNVRFAK